MTIQQFHPCHDRDSVESREVQATVAGTSKPAALAPGVVSPKRRIGTVIPPHEPNHRRNAVADASRTGTGLGAAITTPQPRDSVSTGQTSSVTRRDLYPRFTAEDVRNVLNHARFGPYHRSPRASSATQQISRRELQDTSLTSRNVESAAVGPRGVDDAVASELSARDEELIVIVGCAIDDLEIDRLD